MQVNPGPHVASVLAFDGTTAFPTDIHNYTQFGWTIEATAAVAADVAFHVRYHDGTAADPCIPDAAQPVPEVALCSDVNMTPGPDSQFTIPAGTPAGNLCFVTIPCRPGRFVSLEPVAGTGTTANLRATMTLVGPKR